MPKHERAPSGHDNPRLNRTSEEMMADFEQEMERRRSDPVLYYLGDNPTPEAVEWVRKNELKVPPKGRSRRKRR